MIAPPPPAGLLPWAQGVLGLEADAGMLPVAGDASARRYFRLSAGDSTYIAVHSPPDSQKNREFLAVRQLLEAAGVPVPALYGADLASGFMLLGDLGDRMLLAELEASPSPECYQQAFTLLRKFGAVDPDDGDWPRYDDALFSEELSRFPQWFVGELLGLEQPGADIWRGFADFLKANALAQPTLLVHRDFHSRNLMCLPGGRLGLIDFQDAVIGPVSYDLVSLLRDCYIHWPAGQVEAWALDYLAMLQNSGELPGVEPAQFLRWFDLMGLQRHIKVLGTFARLYLRDNKPAYLDDLPRVIGYVREMLDKYSGSAAEVEAFAGWFEGELMPVIRQQSWGVEL